MTFSKLLDDEAVGCVCVCVCVRVCTCVRVSVSVRICVYTSVIFMSICLSAKQLFFYLIEPVIRLKFGIHFK